MPTFEPGNAKSLELLSVWVSGFAPLSEDEKVKLLRSTDTTERFRRALQGFQALKSPAKALNIWERTNNEWERESNIAIPAAIPAAMDSARRSSI
eukprot:1448742-Pyramimonas_sp.AAC.1